MNLGAYHYPFRGRLPRFQKAGIQFFLIFPSSSIPVRLRIPITPASARMRTMKLGWMGGVDYEIVQHPSDRAVSDSEVSA